MKPNSIKKDPFNNTEKNIALNPFGYVPYIKKQKRIRDVLKTMGRCTMIVISIVTIGIAGCTDLNMTLSKELFKTAIDSAIDAGFSGRITPDHIKYMVAHSAVKMIQYGESASSKLW